MPIVKNPEKTQKQHHVLCNIHQSLMCDIHVRLQLNTKFHEMFTSLGDIMGTNNANFTLTVFAHSEN